MGLALTATEPAVSGSRLTHTLAPSSPAPCRPEPARAPPDRERLGAAPSPPNRSGWRRCPRIAGICNTYGRDAHRRTGAGHITQSGQARLRVHSELGCCVQDRLEELAHLTSEDLAGLVDPFTRPIVDRGMTARPHKRVGQQVLHHGVVGTIRVEIVDPAQLRLDFPLGHILSRRTDGVAYEPTHKTAKTLLIQRRVYGIIRHSCLPQSRRQALSEQCC